MEVHGEGPSPADYYREANRLKPALVLTTRYPVHDDWVLSLVNDAPSPEKYTIDRGLSRKAGTFPKAEFMKERKMEKIGPGSYETATSTVIRKSFNAMVPQEASALG
jgi:hypothetical protein